MKYISCLSTRQYRRDIVIVTVLSVLAAIGSYQGAKLVDLVLFDKSMESAWFQSDIPRIYENMTSRSSDHYRTNVHPLFSLATFPPTKILWEVIGINPLASVRIVVAFAASLWAGAFFVLFRLIGFRRFEAILFSMLGMVGAAATFWFTVPETYSFGSLSILLALIVVAMSQNKTIGKPWYLIISMATLSFTITNWIVGILTSFVSLPLRRAAQITINAFFIIIVLWAVQKYFIPSAGFFLGDRGETKYILTAESGGPIRIAASFFLHSMVMPSISSINDPERPFSPIMTVQHSLPGSGGSWGIVATVLWVVLLALGLWGITTSGKHNKLRLVLGVSLLAQLVLHLLYGEETFLYSLHFEPLLVLLAAFSMLTRFRRLVITYVGILIVCAAVNNWQQFNRAISFIQNNHTARSEVISQMLFRPTDPWPRGHGHVVLAIPGSSESDKGYHEPGGSFSPAAGSFGVSLWVTDDYGNLKATSDDIPFDMLRQSFCSAGSCEIPKILNETPFYHARWSIEDPQHWCLNLGLKGGTKRLTVAIRSVGPSGGPINSLDWNNERLMINNRWHVSIDPAPSSVYLAEEGQKDWMRSRSTATQLQSKSGWGCARFELEDYSNWKISIKDTVCKTPEFCIPTAPQPLLEVSMPGDHFNNCLKAQVSHLLMSLVGTQTRSSDPANTPIPWQRTGAYIIVALARAGHLGAAKELSYYLAEHDFYGGFGPEADAPGLAIWALKEVALRLNNTEYNQWLWPHIARKAGLIQQMLLTEQPIHGTSITPVVPKLRGRTDNTLIAEPARNGLIVGRMDYHRPILYINAVSYRGLIDAALLADRFCHPVEAAHWRTYALLLQRAWGKAFRFPETTNDRTYISALWPTWAATPHTNILIQNLTARWMKQRDIEGGFCDTPLWTYFKIAEAHQWLYLGFHQQVWMTLRWFWDNQASPGLYTWWEDNGEGNTYDGWNQIRGWVNPRHVTPHYWTTAEMLLLQLDMMAYVDESVNEPILVIGSGIPREWLNQDMKVQGLSTIIGYIDWIWRDQEMYVVVKNYQSTVKVRLGAAFPSNTPLRVEYRTYL